MNEEKHDQEAAPGSAFNLKEWISILANIGVILGLVFVGLEVKNSQDDVNTSVAIALSSWGEFNALQTDPAVAEAIWTMNYEPESLTDVQRVQMIGWLYSFVNQFRQSHHLYEVGLMSDREFEAEKTNVAYQFLQPHPRAFLFDDSLQDAPIVKGVEALRVEVLRLEALCVQGEFVCPE